MGDVFMKLVYSVLLLMLTLASFPTVGATNIVPVHKEQHIDLHSNAKTTNLLPHQDLVNMAEKEIYIENTTVGKIPTNLKTIQIDREEYMPLKALQLASNQSIQVDAKTKVTRIFIPHFRIAGDRAYTDDYGKGLYTVLPTISQNGETYVRVNTLGPALGLTYKTVKNTVLLEPLFGAFLLPKKQEISTPLTWVFDPLPNGSAPYSKPLGSSGTTILSPSLYELGEEGLKQIATLPSTYVSQYNQQKMLVWPLLTNQFNPAFTSTILSKKELWNTYSDELINAALVNGYGGYNFDFENVYLKDSKALTEFVTFLSTRLHSFGIYTSVDVTGYSQSPNWSLVYDRKELGQAVDFLVLMAYDETWAKSPIPGPVASYPWVKKNVETLIKEVPAHKVVLGIPFYMRIWQEDVVVPQFPTTHLPLSPDLISNPSNADMGLGYIQPTNVIISEHNQQNTYTPKGVSSKTLSIKDSRVYKNRYPEGYKWDDQLKLYYLSYISSNIVYKIWFEDEASLNEKLSLVKTYHLGGVAAWRKGFEDESILHFIKTYNFSHTGA